MRPVTVASATVVQCRTALEQTMLLGALDDSTLDALAERASVRRYGRGEPVVVTGEPGGDLLVVAEGKLRVLSRSADGVDVVLAVASPGDTLGELSLLDRAPRSATVEATAPSTVVRVPGEAVRVVIRSHPELAEELISQQSATIRRVSGMVADLVFLDVPRRVAKYLLEQLGHRDTADLGMSQSELAATVGGVRQTVNAALRGLERRGWITVTGHTVTLHDRPALEAYAAMSES
jgi:CRP/FNR family cyclic AMP-dependent transcriptional regulator